MTFDEALPFTNALLQGFAAFGSVIGVSSALLAFVEWLRGGSDPTNPHIGQAINVGVAASFLPAVAFGLAIIELSYAATLWPWPSGRSNRGAHGLRGLPPRL